MGARTGVAAALGFVAGLACGLAVIALGPAGEAPPPRAGAPPRTQNGGAVSTPDGRHDPVDAADRPVAGERRDRVRFTARGTITGRVTTEDGTPVAGAIVRSSATGGPSIVPEHDPTQPPRETDVDAQIERYAAMLHWHEARARSTTTGTDGRFRLERISDDDHVVWAWHAGFEIRRARGTSATLRPGADVALVATPVGVVTLEVVVSSGVLPDELTLDARPAGDERRGGRTLRWSPGAPRLRLAPGTWRLELRTRHDSDETAEPVVVEVPASGTDATARLVIAARQRVEGRVTVPDGETWDVLWVWLQALDEGETPDPAAMTATEWRDNVRPPDYAFRMDDVPAGRYALAVGFDNRRAEAARVIEVLPGPTRADLELPRTPPEAMFRIDVRGPDGEIPEGVRLVHEIHRGNGTVRMGLRPQTLPDGRLLLRLPEVHASLLDGSQHHMLCVEHDELGTQEVALGGVQDIAVRFAEPAFAHVRLAGYPDAYPEGGVALVVTPVGAGAFVTQIARSSADGGTVPAADGTLRLGPLAPGAHEIVLGTAVRRPFARTLAVHHVTLVSGRNDVAIPAPALHTLRVTIGSAEAGSSIALRPGRRPGRNYESATAKADAEGVGVFEDLPEGLYLVSHGVGANRGEMLVHVPSDGRVAFVPLRLSTLRVTDIEPGGVMDRCGFREGDRIHRIDGKPFDSSSEAEVRIREVEGPTFAISVLRGGASVDLTVEKARFDGWQGVGGHWVPDTAD